MRWILLPKPEKDKVLQLANALGVDNFVATLLVQRGIETFEDAKKFFRPSLNELHDPLLMKDMNVAVNRIKTAIDNNEQVLISGDYDVDGTTAVTLMSLYLDAVGMDYEYYIPDRYKEGYGLSYEGIDHAEKIGASLINLRRAGHHRVWTGCLLSAARPNNKTPLHTRKRRHAHAATEP